MKPVRVDRSSSRAPRTSAVALLAASLLCAAPSPLWAGPGQVTAITGGVEVETANQLLVTLVAHDRGIVHVSVRPTTARDAPKSVELMVLAAPPIDRAARHDVRSGWAILKTPRGQAEVELASGRTRFRDGDGKIVLQDAAPPAFKPVTVEDGSGYLSVSQQFNRGTDEAVYGLGQHQAITTNAIGQDVELRQRNMVVSIPFLVSTRNYGLLWDNNGAGRFGNPKPYTLLGEDGQPGSVTAGGRAGFRAEYFVGARKVTERQEPTIDYRFVRDAAKWPADVGASGNGGGAAADLGAGGDQRRVVWSGRYAPGASGDHKLRVFVSGYVKLWIDGQLKLDGWRPNFNPWNFDVAARMTAGRPVDIRLEWRPTKGFLGLLHADPLPAQDRRSIWLTSDVARDANYWFVPGTSMDDVIAGYRALTGKAVMIPKWAYGFWQSRQRYKTQAEFEAVAATYRRLKIPIDVLVQDWNYWPEDGWGSHDFERSRFPDPAGMVRKAHELNLRVPISVWPKFYAGTANYKELDKNGFILRRNVELGNRDWVGKGYVSTFYDPYSNAGRAMYWRQVRDKIAKFGFDGWWLDANEPAIQSNVDPKTDTYIKGPLAVGPAAEYLNTYPLLHVGGVDEGSRQFRPNVRPLILTRSGVAGMQRFASVLWSGDTGSSWHDFKAQIPSGVNVAMTGWPNWTHDIGGYSPDLRVKDAPPDSPLADEWRELNLRWFQFGAFTPVFRSHGEGIPREIYLIAPAGSEVRNAMVHYTELRYRLMPYFYSLAGATWLDDASIMRGLVMDYPKDPVVRRVDDQYLLGRELLVAPVTDYRARQRRVYLPGRDALWYDFHSGATSRGAKWIAAAAPLSQMPLFVRAGSILPTGPVRQHVNDLPDAPTTILVYTGASGSFGLYDDDGVSEDYRTGAYSRIPLTYDDRAGVLTFGDRQGKGYAGMPATRKFRVRFITAGQGFDADGASDLAVDYDGRALVVRKSPRPRPDKS